MTITRQAILIGAPSVKPELPGVIADINDIKRFLLSNKGGRWLPSEIVVLIDPSSAAVYKQIKAAENKDYVFITCSGHGEHRVGRGLNETVMYVKEEDTISIDRINPRNKRHLVIVDVCRNLVDIRKKDTVFTMDSTMESASNQFIDHRKIFNNAVMENPEGRIVVYSCDLNQSAGDDGTGGVFTQELLSAPRFLSSASSDVEVVDISRAFERARQMTYEKNAPQRAVFNAGRRMHFYPFAIV